MLWYLFSTFPMLSVHTQLLSPFSLTANFTVSISSHSLLPVSLLHCSEENTVHYSTSHPSSPRSPKHPFPTTSTTLSITYAYPILQTLPFIPLSFIGICLFIFKNFKFIKSSKRTETYMLKTLHSISTTSYHSQVVATVDSWVFFFFFQTFIIH